MTAIRYPDIKVRLSGRDGSAFAIIGSVAVALRKHDVPKETIDEFRRQALGGDYTNVISTACDWVDVR